MGDRLISRRAVMDAVRRIKTPQGYEGDILAAIRAVPISAVDTRSVKSAYHTGFADGLRKGFAACKCRTDAEARDD